MIFKIFLTFFVFRLIGQMIRIIRTRSFNPKVFSITIFILQRLIRVGFRVRTNLSREPRNNKLYQFVSGAKAVCGGGALHACSMAIDQRGRVRKRRGRKRTMHDCEQPRGPCEENTK